MGFEEEIPDPNAGGGNEGGALLIREFRSCDFHCFSDHLFTPVITLNGLSENLTGSSCLIQAFCVLFLIRFMPSKWVARRRQLERFILYLRVNDQ